MNSKVVIVTLDLYCYLRSEKKLLVSNDDCGKDLTSVNNLRKKQKRIELEINSHEPNIERILVSAL